MIIIYDCKKNLVTNFLIQFIHLVFLQTMLFLSVGNHNLKVVAKTQKHYMCVWYIAFKDYKLLFLKIKLSLNKALFGYESFKLLF